jgi:replication factor C subunit 3/5
MSSSNANKKIKKLVSFVKKEKAVIKADDPPPACTTTPAIIKHSSRTTEHHQTTPWVEKYRPHNFDEIVLDPLNRTILKNILDTNYFPNLLFYGPPGTGKTTTIINLVNSYQEKLNLRNKGFMIHLNASDDRGIEIIRTTINNFVSSKSLFGEGMKFVILDEVDYMTKNAQIALRYLLNSYNTANVRFCLICNYVSRIDESLQSEFVRMRFNQLPEQEILHFLRKINESEKLGLTDDTLTSIQRQFNSDIRSMINYMQTNQDVISNCNIITDDIWETLTDMFKAIATKEATATKATPTKEATATKGKISSSASKKTKSSKTTTISSISPYDFINETSLKYNIEQKNIIKNYLNYIIRKRPELVTRNLLKCVENVMHLQDPNTIYVLKYIIYKFQTVFSSVPA